MKKLNSKALEVLDICVASEPQEIKAKISEILEVGELDAGDPMFLVLGLTGQMRVLLEADPADLSKHLNNWKETSATSLQSIQQAIELVLATQQQQADTVRRTLESVAKHYVENIKEAGMATTSAIAGANSETLLQTRLAALRAIERLRLSVLKMIYLFTVFKL